MLEKSYLLIKKSMALANGKQIGKRSTHYVETFNDPLHYICLPVYVCIYGCCSLIYIGGLLAAFFNLGGVWIDLYLF